MLFVLEKSSVSKHFEVFGKSRATGIFLVIKWPGDD